MAEQESGADAVWARVQELEGAGHLWEAAAALGSLAPDDPWLAGATELWRGQLLAALGNPGSEVSLRTAICHFETVGSALKEEGFATPHLIAGLAHDLAAAAHALATVLRADRPAEALSVLAPVLEGADLLPPELHGEVAGLAGELAADLGDEDTAVAQFATAADLCGLGAMRAHARFELGWAALHAVDVSSATRWLQQALADADAIGDEAMAARIGACLAHAFVQGGREADAGAAAEQAVAQADRAGVADAGGRGRALLRVLAVARGDHAEAEAATHDDASAATVGPEAFAALGTGRIADAEALIATLDEMAPSAAAEAQLGYLHGLVAAARGQGDAVEHLLRARAAATPVDAALIDVSIAAVEGAQGDWRTSGERARAAARMLGDAGLLAEQARALVVGASADLAAGAFVPAADAAAAAIALLAQTERRELNALAELVRARALASVDPEGALAASITAVSTFDDIRHALIGTPNRNAYSDRTAEVYEVSIDIAGGCDRPEAVAELLLRAQTQAVPRPTLDLRTGIGLAEPVEVCRVRAAVVDRFGIDGFVPLALPARLAVEGEPLVGPGDRLPVIRVPALARCVTGTPLCTTWVSWAGRARLHWALVDEDGSTESGAMDLGAVAAVRDALQEAVEAGRRRERSRLTDVDAEAFLARQAGRALLPPPLVERLEDRHSADGWHVVVHPSSIIGRIPPGWLAGPSGRRLIEAAVIHHAAPLGVLADVLGRPPSERGEGVVSVIDPGGQRLFALPPLVPHGALATRAGHHLALAARPDLHTPADRAAARRLAQRPRPRLVAYVGHISMAPGGSPAAAGFVLGDGEVSARQWLEDAGSFPVGDTTALLACSSSGHGRSEWSGLATVALWHGSRRVVTSVWDLVNHAPTTALVEDLLDALATGDDAPEAIRRLQADALDRWRHTGHKDAAPLYWAPFASSGLAPCDGVNAP